MAITITVPASQVDANLSGFVVAVNLSTHMPASFWANVSEDGPEIRVFDDTPTRIPAYAHWCNPVAETGWLYFRAPTLSSSVDTEFSLDLGGTPQAHGDTFGRNAVFDDCEVVLLLGHDPNDATGKGGPLEQFSSTNAAPSMFEEVGSAWANSSHDGVATDRADPTYYIGFDETTLRRFNSSKTQTGTSTTFATDAGLSGYFAGAGAVYNGVIYTTLKDVNTESPNEKWVALYDASDFSFIKKFEITDLGGSGFGIECAGVYYNPDDELLYFVLFDSVTARDVIRKYDPVAETYEGDITMSAGLTSMQGIVKWREAFWIAGGGDIRRVELDGTLHGTVAIGVAQPQGISITLDNDRLLVSESGGTAETHEFAAYDFDLSGGGGLDVNSASTFPAQRARAALSAVGVLGDDWMVGFSFRTDDNSQDTLLTLTSAGSGLQADRTNIVNRDGNKLGVWDTSNGWHHADPNLDPEGGGTPTFYRCNVYYDGTTERAIYWNGSNKNTDSGITARGGGAEYVSIGSASAGSFESPLNGAEGFIYARASIPTNVDAWVAAEFSMLDDNGAFLSVSGDVGGTPPAKPVLTVDAIRENDADLSIAGFTAGEGGTHDKSQWRAYLSGGDPVADLVYDSEASNDLLAHTTDDDLPPGTALDFEARVLETPSGLWSEWSDPVTDTTDADTSKPATPSVLSASGTTGVTSSSSVYSHPGALDHAASRWQTVVDGGDPDDEGDVVHDSGPDGEALEAYTSPADVLEPSTAYDQYVTHIDENGGEARSGPFDFTTSAIGIAGGGLFQFLDAPGGTVIESHQVTTDATEFVELLIEGMTRPAGAPFAQLVPLKLGTEEKTVTVRHASVDKGNMAIGFKPRPYMPEVDDFFNHGAVSASSTIDWSRGRFQTIELDANLVATHLNARVGQELHLQLTQDGTGGRTVDLGALEQPAYSSGAGDVDYVVVRKTGPATYVVILSLLDVS